MKFPVHVKHRKSEAVIYGKTTGYPFYRVAYRAAGKRQIRSFATYTLAREAAEAKVRELDAGNQSAGLSAKEASGAIAIRDALESFRRETGRKLSPSQIVMEYLHAAKLLGQRPLGEAVEAYIANVATVKQKGLAEAVEDFIALRAPKAVARDGKRSALNPKYVENTATWLRSFAMTFPGHKVGDLTKEHLNGYIAGFNELSAKSRNDRRAVVKLFLAWCVRNDFLTPTHRLAEAEEMRMEHRDTAPTDCYRPDELRTLLENATGEMRAVIALQGLGGLRLEEALRLDWREVFTIAGHVEVSTAKSKTRSRRLVEICPALEHWLTPFRGWEGCVGARWATANAYVRDFAAVRNRLKILSRKNGLRHGFCTCHFALHNNENLTAAQAGNSPAIIHAHYKGLATKAEAEQWFAVGPSATSENTNPLANKA